MLVMMMMMMVMIMMRMVPCHGPGAVHMYVAAETKLCNNHQALLLCMMMGDGDDEDEIINRSMNR